MQRTHRRGRVAPGIVLACMLAACPYVFALNPALDVSQYAHTSWKIRDGFTKGEILSMAQTPDGYLWLGTAFGLFRFDGLKNVPWQPPANQQLPSSHISSLLAARDGTLWIGTLKGLTSWKSGKLTQYAELAGQAIFRLLEDHESTVWVGGVAVPTGKLCSIQNGSVKCYGEDGSLGLGVTGLFEDSKSNLWVGVQSGLWRWKPGPPKFYPMPGEPNGIRALDEDEDGTLLVGWNGKIQRFVDGKAESYPLPDTLGQFRPKRLLRDRDGGLWIGTQDRGIVHVHQGRTDVFAPSDGLSSENVNRIFEDREGNIWVATVNGLDRFHEFAVPTFNVNQGLSNAIVGSVLTTRDGSIWMSTYGGLNRWNNGQITVYRERTQKTLTGVREIVGSGLPDRGVESLFEDDRGRVWVATHSQGVGYLENDRFVSISGIPGGGTLSISEDTAGNLWIVNEPSGLFQLPRGGEVKQILWAGLGHKDHASTVATDPLRGGLWLGFHLGGVAYFTDGQIHASYTAADGLGEGRVNQLRFDQDGILWAATDGGLSRLKDGRIATLTGKNGLPCDAVHWVMEDDTRAVWLHTDCGLLRIARPELDAWTATVEKDKDAKPVIRVTVFDSSDGPGIMSEAGHFSPQVAKSADGRLWFQGNDGVNVVDPRHLPFNKLPPPVHVEQLIADRKTYAAISDASGRLSLPPLIRDLQIDYTALSLVAPEKIRFRYKLEGHDCDWQDVGPRRQAFYNDLPPRNYRFHVMACNNSGVWNEAGTFLDFFVAPAYYQTTWFRVSCAAAFLAVLAVLYQLRLRQVARQFTMRMEERVNERTRLARDLHDTLLQSFQGVLLKFSVLSYRIPDRPEIQKELENVIEQAREAITEGRNAVQGLRASTVVANDLAQAISAFGEALVADQSAQNTPNICVRVEGPSRDLAPLVRDEVYRIAAEAVRNAFCHAQASRIEVEIRYDPRQFRLWARDDGKGIDPKVLSEGGRAGHHGLPGMQERARLVGGKLAVFSRVDSGTEVELTIPASLAYAKSHLVRRWMFSGRRT